MTFISQLKHLARLEETRHWALATKLAEHPCLAQNLRSFAILAEYKLYNLAVDIEVWLLNYCRAVLLSADAFRASLTGLSQFLLATIEEAWRWACLSTSQVKYYFWALQTLSWPYWALQALLWPHPSKPLPSVSACNY